MALNTDCNHYIKRLKSAVFIGVLMIVTQNCSSEDDTNTGGGAPQNPNIENIEFTTATTAKNSKGEIYEVGFNQVSSINQDPFIRKKNASGETIWYIEHEKSEVDGRAKMILIDSNDTPWVVFTVVGGSNNDTYITTHQVEDGAFSNVYQKNFGTGGGPKVAILARLNPDTGKIQKATYIIAKKNDGKTNGFNIQEIGIKDRNLAILANTAAWPPAKGSSYSRFPEITDSDRIDGDFKMYYEINTTLTEIVEADIFRK